MILKELVLENFTSFPGKHTIDFTKYNQIGLFCITGKTGAGKSSLLNAISFALYQTHHNSDINTVDLVHHGMASAKLNSTFAEAIP